MKYRVWSFIVVALVSSLAIPSLAALGQDNYPKYGVYAGENPNQGTNYQKVRVRFALAKGKSGALESVSGVFNTEENDGTRIEGKLLGSYSRTRNKLSARIEKPRRLDGPTGSVGAMFLVDGRFNQSTRAFDLEFYARTDGRNEERQYFPVRRQFESADALGDPVPILKATCTHSRVEVGSPVVARVDFEYPRKPRGPVEVMLRVRGPSNDFKAVNTPISASGKGFQKFEVTFDRPGAYALEFDLALEGKSHTARVLVDAKKSLAPVARKGVFSLYEETTQPSRQDNGHPENLTSWTSSPNSLVAELKPRKGDYPAAKTTINWSAPPRQLTVGQTVELTISSSIVLSALNPPRLNVEASYVVEGSVVDLKGTPAFCGWTSKGEVVLKGAGKVTFKVGTGGTIALGQVVYGLGFSPVSVYRYRYGAPAQEPAKGKVTKLTIKAVS